MCIYTSQAVWQKSISKGGARLVLLCIADHTNDKGLSWPSTGTIAREANISERQITRALAELDKLGELEIVQKGDGRGNSSVYRILLEVDKPSKDGAKVDSTATLQETEKGDILSVKGDILSQKVDILSTKVDMVSSKPLEPSNNHQEPSKEPARKRQPKKELVFEIPENLNNEQFLVAWGDYVTHRQEIKKPLTPVAAKRQLKQLEEWGIVRAVAAINHSVAKGWLSIYEPKEYQNGRSGHNPARPIPAPASERVGGAF